MASDAIVTAGRPAMFRSWRHALGMTAIWLAFAVLSGVPTALLILWAAGWLR